MLVRIRHAGLVGAVIRAGAVIPAVIGIALLGSSKHCTAFCLGSRYSNVTPSSARFFLHAFFMHVLFFISPQMPHFTSLMPPQKSPPHPQPLRHFSNACFLVACSSDLAPDWRLGAALVFFVFGSLRFI
jgi:hypothetical protein